MITIETKPGGTSYGFPFLGPTDHQLSVQLKVNTLTIDEVDALGYLKPGVPLTINGTLVGAATASAVAAAVAATGNTGNGTVGSVTGKTSGVSEVLTLRAKSATVFSVRGSRSGILADATVGTPYTSTAANFTIVAGGTAFVAGDEFTLKITQDAGSYVFGASVAAVKIVAANPTNVSLAADSRTIPLVVCVMGIVQRDIVEDNLGRDLTPAEVAAFALPGCKLVLSRT